MNMGSFSPPVAIFGSNVRDYGAVGNGVVDDTSAISGAMAASVNGIVYIPKGTFRITAPLDITASMSGISIMGLAPESSIIRQDTSNTPVIRCRQALVHSVGIHNVQLTYLTQQTLSDTDAYGIQWAASGDAGVQHNFFLWRLTNIKIVGAYTAIGLRALDTGKDLCHWGSYWESITCQDYAHIGVNLVSPNSVGMPNMVMNRMYFIGQNTKADSYALTSGACELRITGFEVNNQDNRQVYVFGGAPVIIAGLHLESIAITQTDCRVIEVANNNLKIDGLEFQNATLNAGGTLSVVHVSTGGSIDITGWRNGLTITSGAAQLLSIPAGASRNGGHVRALGLHVGITPGTISGVAGVEKLGDPIQSFTSLDATPSVFGFYVFKTANASSTTITTFDDGHSGQEILIIFTDANTTVSEANNIKLSAAFTSSADDTMRLVYDGTSWYELSRSVN